MKDPFFWPEFVLFVSMTAELVTFAFVVSFSWQGFEVSTLWIVPLAVFFIVTEIAMSVFRQRVKNYLGD